MQWSRCCDSFSIPTVVTDERAATRWLPVMTFVALDFGDDYIPVAHWPVFTYRRGDGDHSGRRPLPLTLIYCGNARCRYIPGDTTLLSCDVWATIQYVIVHGRRYCDDVDLHTFEDNCCDSRWFDLPNSLLMICWYLLIHLVVIPHWSYIGLMTTCVPLLFVVYYRTIYTLLICVMLLFIQLFIHLLLVCWHLICCTVVLCWYIYLFPILHYICWHLLSHICWEHSPVIPLVVVRYYCPVSHLLLFPRWYLHSLVILICAILTFGIWPLSIYNQPLVRTVILDCVVCWFVRYSPYPSDIPNDLMTPILLLMETIWCCVDDDSDDVPIGDALFIWHWPYLSPYLIHLMTVTVPLFVVVLHLLLGILFDCLIQFILSHIVHCSFVYFHICHTTTFICSYTFPHVDLFPFHRLFLYIYSHLITFWPYSGPHLLLLLIDQWLSLLLTLIIPLYCYCWWFTVICDYCYCCVLCPLWLLVLLLLLTLLHWWSNRYLLLLVFVVGLVLLTHLECYFDDIWSSTHIVDIHLFICWWYCWLSWCVDVIPFDPDIVSVIVDWPHWPYLLAPLLHLLLLLTDIVGI